MNLLEHHECTRCGRPQPAASALAVVPVTSNRCRLCRGHSTCHDASGWHAGLPRCTQHSTSSHRTSITPTRRSEVCLNAVPGGPIELSASSGWREEVDSAEMRLRDTSPDCAASSAAAAAAVSQPLATTSSSAGLVIRSVDWAETREGELAGWALREGSQTSGGGGGSGWRRQQQRPQPPLGGRAREHLEACPAWSAAPAVRNRALGPSFLRSRCKRHKCSKRGGDCDARATVRCDQLHRPGRRQRGARGGPAPAVRREHTSSKIGGANWSRMMEFHVTMLILQQNSRLIHLQSCNSQAAHALTVPPTTVGAAVARTAPLPISTFQCLPALSNSNDLPTSSTDCSTNHQAGSSLPTLALKAPQQQEQRCTQHNQIKWQGILCTVSASWAPRCPGHPFKRPLPSQSGRLFSIQTHPGRGRGAWSLPPPQCR